MLQSSRTAGDPPAYEPGEGWDEAIDRDGAPRPGYAELFAALAGHDLDELSRSVEQERSLIHI